MQALTMRNIGIIETLEVYSMKLNNILHQRQYNITLSSEEMLNLDKVQFMGIWSNTDSCHYLVTINPTEDKLANSITFENEFRKITGLDTTQAQIESKYGPLNLQRAVDSPWF